MARTLLEAAADVLNKSRSDTPKEPMHNLAADRGTDGLAGQQNVVDLGGATYENPAGAKTGEKIAAARPQSTPPGVKPDSDTKAPMQDLETVRGKQPGTEKAGEKSSPEEHDGAHAAEHGSYAHPTSEETELTEEEIEAAKAERWEHAKEVMKSMSVKEDIDALFSGETLTEEFKTKAATIFEAAVVARAITVAEALEEEILDAAEEALADSQVAMEEQVDTYLNFVVENWVKENQVAIESGLRSEIVEDFISGLKNLFVEHYVDVPSEKVDVVESQAQEIADLTDKVNEALNANADLVKKLSESKKVEILATVSEGLTDTQAVKLKTLTESVEFTTEGEYTSKLKTIRESYFSAGNKTTVKQEPSIIQLTEEAPGHVEEEVPANMAAYVKAISRTQTY